MITKVCLFFDRSRAILSFMVMLYYDWTSIYKGLSEPYGEGFLSKQNKTALFLCLMAIFGLFQGDL